MKNLIRFGCMLAILFATSQLLAQNKWPKEILLEKTGGKVIIYQPQPDAFEGNKLSGRVAIGVKEKAKDELVFGAVFFDAKMMTDKARHTATLESITVKNAKITGVDDQDKLNKLITLLETEVPKWDMEISLDQLIATIKKDHPNAEVYNNDPPKIYYREKPTTLVILDGDPKIQKDKNLDADRVVNSPYLIFKEGAVWNMYVGGIWYQSASVLNGWTASKSMSKKVKSINDQIKKQEKESNDNKEVTAKPEVTDIIVSTVPAEVIQTKGAPVYKKIDSTSLQFVSNSSNDILKTTDGSIYLLLAGRWYKSSSLNGPWTFNESDKLPVDFAKIPEGSDKDNVLVSVSGTNAADEAIIDAEIPQTAKVDRKTAGVKVEYDGEPKFENIDGTSLQLAANSSLTVLKDATGNYFALDNGVWFVSSNAKSGWKVADTRPQGLESIPAKSPAYNSKFVYIYETAPDYVVVGYTGGYLNNYVQGDPTIVFGTGFYYTPWYGAVYYPRPCTWGFNFCYNPYTGWSMGFSVNVGFLSIGFGGPSYGYGWFGPPMYRPPYRPPYYGGGYYGRPGGGYGNHYGNNNVNINVNNNHNNIYRPGNGNNNNRPGISNNNRPNNNNRPGSNYRPGNNNNNNNNRPGNNNNIGGNNNRPGNNNNGNNNNRPGNNNGGNWNNNDRSKPSPSASNQPNNVFADKQGNVFQKDNKGNLNQRDNKANSWKPAPSVDNGTRRDVQSRDRSNDRSNNFNRATSPGANRAPGGGGGGRPAPQRPAGGGGGQRGRRG